MADYDGDYEVLARPPVAMGTLDDRDGDNDSDGLTLKGFTDILIEIQEQPAWRQQANREMDYLAGNQLDSDILQKMKERGIPPAIENLVGPAIESIMGAEAKKRTDWRVIPDGAQEGQDVADAFNEKLNEAERRSRADRGCSDAYLGQVSVGIGWLEVGRERDPFKYPYRCTPINRNEIYWDWFAKDPMLADARWLLRTKWYPEDVVKLMFPEQAELIGHIGNGWTGYDPMFTEGSQSTGLFNSLANERGFTIEEAEWRNTSQHRLRLYEVWTRCWHNALVLRLPDGRVKELDPNNPIHFNAVAYGIKPVWAMVSKVRQSWWCGPHKLADNPSPHRHKHFPYVPFWGHKEDQTGVPYGRIRNMMYQQDNVNATQAKIRWGLAARVIQRTKGAVAMKDEQFRQMVARPDADIILDAKHMGEPGAQFKIDRNFEINEQQYKMLADARTAIQKAAGITNEFQGIENTSRSGVQENARIEQSQQALADLDDNFRESRTQVGELLLSMIVQDSIGQPEQVMVSGRHIKPDKLVDLNRPVQDETGYQYFENDVERTLLKVTLDDVPSSPSFRTQQLNALSEAYKAAPPEYQRIMMPHMMALMDVPDKEEIIKAIKEADAQPSQDMLEMQRKMQELDIKARLIEAQVKQIEANAVKTLNEAQYNAIQTAATAVQMPATMPVADKVMENSGYVHPVPAGVDPGLSDIELQQAQQQAVQQQAAQSPNTNPTSPKPVLSQPDGPAASPNAGQAQGIETQRVEDNV